MIKRFQNDMLTQCSKVHNSILPRFSLSFELWISFELWFLTFD